MQSLLRIYLAVSMIFVAISCSDVKFHKSAKDVCLGDDRACNVDPSNNELTFDYTETVPFPDNRVDILFVIDNSKSMLDDQQQMASRFADFMSSINGLDWRIGIVTTDMRNQGKEYQGGKLVPFRSGSQIVTYVLDKTVPNYETLFKSTIQRKETQDCIAAINANRPWECDVLLSGDERGIYAAKTAISNNDRSFMRAGAPLRVVIISDEDERSAGGRCLPSNFQSNIECRDQNNTYKVLNFPMEAGRDVPEDFVLAANHMGKSMIVYSIVVNNSTCLGQQRNSPYNDSSFLGIEYATLSDLTGGIVGSVCAGSYTPQLQAISQDIDNGIRDTIKDLACVPKNNTVELYNPATAASPMVITNVTSKSFSVNPPLHPGDTYRVRYVCVPL